MFMTRKNTLLLGMACFPAMTAMLAGCAGSAPQSAIRAGDRVGIQFTCRLANGELAAATSSEANNSAQPKSPLFVKRSRNDAVEITAGDTVLDLREAKKKSFEDWIMNRLAVPVIGMRQGGEADVEISAERPALPQEDQFITIPRIRRHAKEMKMPLDKFKLLAKRDPEVGKPFTIDPAFPGTVVGVAGQEVELRFAPVAPEVDLPFGRGIISDKGDHYEIDIQAKKGALVRSSGLAGRIVDAGPDFIKLDYGHPFAGETLKCHVAVESVQPAEKAAATADGVEPGDLVSVNYTAMLDDGSVFGTTLESVAKDPARKKVAWFREPASYGPGEVVAGKAELLPGLGEAVLGLASGAKKEIRLSADKAFGQPDPQKLVQFPCSRELPRTVRMPAEEYTKRFASFPVMNKEVDLIPYFKAKVTEVEEHDVALQFQAKEGQTFSDTYGTVTVHVKEDTITTTLAPAIGAEFPLKDGVGIISATDGVTFTVDANNPLASKSVVIDFEVVSVTKKASLKTGAIQWVEGYEQGLAEGEQAKKPVFLLLYADWCGWCKKTLNETLPDPRIASLRDRFVWAKVNSDKEHKYMEMFGQNGFPMMVLLRPDGTVLKKIEGYRDAESLKGELESVL